MTGGNQSDESIDPISNNNLKPVCCLWATSVYYQVYFTVREPLERKKTFKWWKEPLEID